MLKNIEMMVLMVIRLDTQKKIESFIHLTVRALGADSIASTNSENDGMMVFDGFACRFLLVVIGW